MRRLWIMTALAAGLGLAGGAGAASAADGCGYGPGGYYCQPGAQPGVPYEDGDRRYYRQRYYGEPYYQPRYRRSYDPGPEIALGFIGAVGSAIAAQQYYGHRRYKKARRR